VCGRSDIPTEDTDSELGLTRLLNVRLSMFFKRNRQTDKHTDRQERCVTGYRLTDFFTNYYCTFRIHRSIAVVVVVRAVSNVGYVRVLNDHVDTVVDAFSLWD
jgi:hypothetical protein